MLAVDSLGADGVAGVLGVCCMLRAHVLCFEVDAFRCFLCRQPDFAVVCGLTPPSVPLSGVNVSMDMAMRNKTFLSGRLCTAMHAPTPQCVTTSVHTWKMFRLNSNDNIRGTGQDAICDQLLLPNVVAYSYWTGSRSPDRLRGHSSAPVPLQESE